MHINIRSQRLLAEMRKDLFLATRIFNLDSVKLILRMLVEVQDLATLAHNISKVGVVSVGLARREVSSVFNFNVLLGIRKDDILRDGPS
jgi:hypothetical protein